VMNPPDWILAVGSIITVIASGLYTVWRVGHSLGKMEQKIDANLSAIRGDVAGVGARVQNLEIFTGVPAQVATARAPTNPGKP
jgi:hypothetical protein